MSGEYSYMCRKKLYKSFLAPEEAAQSLIHRLKWCHAVSRFRLLPKIHLQSPEICDKLDNKRCLFIVAWQYSCCLSPLISNTCSLAAYNQTHETKETRRGHYDYLIVLVWYIAMVDIHSIWLLYDLRWLIFTYSKYFKHFLVSAVLPYNSNIAFNMNET